MFAKIHYFCSLFNIIKIISYICRVKEPIKSDTEKKLEQKIKERQAKRDAAIKLHKELAEKGEMVKL